MGSHRRHRAPAIGNRRRVQSEEQTSSVSFDEVASTDVPVSASFASAMRCTAALLLALAATVSAQPTTVGDLDARIVALDQEIAALDEELTAIHAQLDGVRNREGVLDRDRLDFQDRIRAFQRERTRYQIEAGRVRAMYEDLLDYGGSDAERQAYDDAVLDLDIKSEWLAEEARVLQAETDDLNTGYRVHADRVRQTAGRGQRLSQRRAALLHERDILDARRRRLAARRR